MNNLKKIFIFFLFLLTGCNQAISVEYEMGTINYVYAVNSSNNMLEKVIVEYEISSEEDIFLLYTNYSNRLPLGYYSLAHSNINLINCYSDDFHTYYEVDNFINLVLDLDGFRSCLTKTNQLYGYKEAIILKNGNILT